MADSLRILFASAEATPFSKVGGLADVAGSLPQALAARGHDVKLITPKHKPGGASSGEWQMSFQGRQQTINYEDVDIGKGARALLVDDGEHFPRETVYGQDDDLERYLLFCQAVLELPKHLDWRFDVLHLNDWHTGPAAFGLRNYAWEDEFYRGAASVFTIHNLRYRGPGQFLDLIQPAIFYAGAVTTVSPTYSREILTPELGEGLHEMLGMRRDDLFGVVNGIDYQEFNPATDKRISANFDVDSLDARDGNKSALQSRLGLEQSRLPLAGMVARLSEQKGIDITLPAIEPLLQQGLVQLVILGAGDKQYEESARDLAERYPRDVSVTIGFDAELAQQIYAGSDIFLMPSRFEPCGLGQMIALRYGSIPVVRKTGGLADTVPDVRGDDEGLGYVFEDYSAQEMQQALTRAVDAFSNHPDGWRTLQRRGMQTDFSWDASAARYQEIYERILKNR